MKSHVLFIIAFVTLASPACVVYKTPEIAAPMPSVDGWEVVLSGPNIIEVESTVSANWQVPLKGLLNLDNPLTTEAGLENHATNIVLPVHLLKHPTAGIFLIDSGVTEKGAKETKGLVRSFSKSMEPVASIESILDGREEALSGVLLTHAHMDHILGIPAIPNDVPIYFGRGELSSKAVSNSLLRRTNRHLFSEKTTLLHWDFDGDSSTIEAIDVIGDGSLWALETLGHTPGSTCYLAHTTDGPVLFLGDTSHTIWGWENDVAPGTYTVDQGANIESLQRLKTLSAKLPGVMVFMGHELFGDGTGVEAQ